MRCAWPLTVQARPSWERLAMSFTHVFALKLYWWMFPTSSRAKRSSCDAQIWMNFAGAWLMVPARCESPLRYSSTLIGSSLTAVVLVRVTLDAAERVVPERRPVDRDEHGGSRPRRPTHPDRGRHGSRDRVDALPHAAGRPEIPPARCRLALAFLEPIPQESIHNVLRRGAPPMLPFDPAHPALLAKLIEAMNGLHLVLPDPREQGRMSWIDRKSTRLNSSHVAISYAVFCL